MSAALVYLLCALTSVFCVILLSVNYHRSRVKLLFWTAICFSGFALNNVLLFADLVMFPSWDLSAIRLVPALVGVGLLLWGLVWESI